MNRKLALITALTLLVGMLNVAFNVRARATSAAVLHIEQPELFVSESWLYVDRSYNGPNVEERLWKRVVADIEEWSGQSLYKITDEFLKNNKTVTMITTWRTKQWVDLRSSSEYEDATVELAYDPGYENYEFPLYVGQEWENSANLSQTTTYSDGKVENISYLRQDHQTVISEETIAVKAGNFTALKIKVDYGSGLEGYIDYIWFSSDAKNWVKWESYFNSTLVETAELQSLGKRALSNDTRYIIIAAIAVSLAVIFAFIAFRARKKPPPPPPPN